MGRTGWPRSLALAIPAIAWSLAACRCSGSGTVSDARSEQVESIEEGDGALLDDGTVLPDVPDADADIDAEVPEPDAADGDASTSEDAEDAGEAPDEPEGDADATDADAFDPADMSCDELLVALVDIARHGRACSASCPCVRVPFVSTGIFDACGIDYAGVAAGCNGYAGVAECADVVDLAAVVDELRRTTILGGRCADYSAAFDFCAEPRGGITTCVDGCCIDAEGFYGPCP